MTEWTDMTGDVEVTESSVGFTGSETVRFAVRVVYIERAGHARLLSFLRAKR